MFVDNAIFAEPSAQSPILAVNNWVIAVFHPVNVK